MLAQIAEANRNGARRAQATTALGLCIRTLERWAASECRSDGRKGASKHGPHALSEEEKSKVLSRVNSAEFRDLPPSKIVPRLADKGEYLASESSIYRLLKTEKQLAHRQKSAPRVHRKPDALTATAPNQVWTWDITYLKTLVRGSYYYLYMHIDIFSRKIVGWQVNECESAEYAAELFKGLCVNENVTPYSLRLHSDNGSPMKGATMLATLEHLGVIPSFSRPSVSDDNPYSEALFKTLKYHPAFPEKPFESIDGASSWVNKFVNWYNNEHLHSGISFVTPASRHRLKDKEILEKRRAVYEAARERNPLRWSGNTRAWKCESEVTLNSRRADSCKKVSA